MNEKQLERRRGQIQKDVTRRAKMWMERPETRPPDLRQWRSMEIRRPGAFQDPLATWLKVAAEYLRLSEEGWDWEVLEYLGGPPEFLLLQYDPPRPSGEWPGP